MFSTREIWEAGRAALGLLPTAATVPDATALARTAATVPAATAPDVQENTVEENSVFDPSAFTFSPGAYRIHFKNGCSGEYDGAALATSFPFDVAQIERVEPVEEVGQDL